jgi:hypothetical protein
MTERRLPDNREVDQQAFLDSRVSMFNASLGGTVESLDTSIDLSAANSLSLFIRRTNLR